MADPRHRWFLELVANVGMVGCFSKVELSRSRSSSD
jgi:hypothetical protein